MKKLINTPIIWTIAGVDASAAAGVYADLATFQDFKMQPAAITTLLSAQTSVAVNKIVYCEPSFVAQQIQNVHQEFPPDVIKIGAIGKKQTVTVLYDFLKNYSGKVIFDPVLKSTSGYELTQQIAYESINQLILPNIDLLTPNLYEASQLLKENIKTHDDMISAAHKFLQMGCKAVLIKGGHLKNHTACDYFSDGATHFWLNTPRLPLSNIRGTGCRLSAAIAACLAQKETLYDALVRSRLYLQNKIRHSVFLNDKTQIITHAYLYNSIQCDLPWISPEIQTNNLNFPDCGPRPLGLYPLVDSTERVRYCLERNITAIQLRIKNKPIDIVEKEIVDSIQLSKHYNARLFVNDYWDLAIKHQAYGVHLGQEDLNSANLDAIVKAGLRLGISTHSDYEIARAHAIKPSYIAYGPIYPSNSKLTSFTPRGLTRLKYWTKLLNYPIVAIGGINPSNYQDVWNTGVDSVAFISSIEQFLESAQIN